MRHNARWRPCWPVGARLVDFLTVERNRLHSSRDPYVQADLQEVISYLEGRREQQGQALQQAGSAIRSSKPPTPC
jgi:hypothetical protein